MELQLKNIGMIKEANVKIDGLTVIAGENDTGKSTVGKALFFISEFEELFSNKSSIKDIITQENTYKEKLKKLQTKVDELSSNVDNLDFDNDVNSWTELNSLINKTSKQTSSIIKEIDETEKILKLISILKEKPEKEITEIDNKNRLYAVSNKFKDIFYFELKDNAELILTNGKSYEIGISKKKILSIESDRLFKNNSVFIETPIVLNLFSHFSKLDTVQNEINYNIINYPYIMRSLYKKLKLETNKKIDTLNIDIKDIINGEIVVNESGDLVFKREDTLVGIQSTATGIKSFGIIQMLLNNGYLSDGTILILDEPEVHLHPKWQLEMAKILVELVANGVKIVINSHSPYMIEALKRYSELESNVEDKTYFYLAENGYVLEQDNLEKIFEKLAIPMRELKKLKMEKYLHD